MALWIVRAGDKGQQEEGVLKNNIIAIEWNQLADLSKYHDFDSLYKYYKQIHPRKTHKKKTDYDKSSRLKCGEVWAFLNEIQVGDLVVLPSKKSDEIYIGRINGDYKYKQFTDNIKHSRSVEWLTNVKKSTIPKKILNSLGTGLTVFQVKKNDAENYIQNLLKEGQGGATVGALITTVSQDKFEEGEKLIQEFLKQTTSIPFTGFDHPTLVEEVEYKLDIQKKARQKLELEKWKEWKKTPGKIINAVKDACSVGGNLLQHGYGPQGNSDAPLYTIDKTKEFEEILYDLFFGGSSDPKDFGKRVDKLINFVYENKAKTTWQFFSFLAFLFNPEIYFPIGPEAFDISLNFYGVKEKLSRERK
ncbi:MAG: hypothetical protein WD512_00780, partial [Candidatus Paceibacterota bacterium]